MIAKDVKNVIDRHAHPVVQPGCHSRESMFDAGIRRGPGNDRLDVLFVPLAVAALQRPAAIRTAGKTVLRPAVDAIRLGTISALTSGSVLAARRVPLDGARRMANRGHETPPKTIRISLDTDSQFDYALLAANGWSLGIFVYGSHRSDSATTE